MDLSCQIIIGPPNSGKSKYCAAMAKLYETTKQDATFVNLDPACEHLDYTPTADIREFTTIEDFADGIGLSAATDACLQLLLNNIDWLTSAFDSFKDGTVFIDCPGVSITSTSFSIILSIIEMLLARNMKICYINIVDAQNLCSEVDLFAACINAAQLSETLTIPGLNLCSNFEELDSDHKNFLSQFLEWGNLSTKIKNLTNVPENIFNVCFKSAHSKFSSDMMNDLGNDVAFIPLESEKVSSIDNLFKVIVGDQNERDDENGFNDFVVDGA